MFALAMTLATTLSVHDYATLPTLSSPRVSPDGGRVAYVLTRAEMSRSVYVPELRVIGAGGEDDLLLATAATAPRWSPDGKWIAFLSDREGRNAIYRIAAGGGEAEKLSAETSAIRDLQWSPDGTRIAYVAREPVSAEEERRAKEHEDARVAGENERPLRLSVMDVATKHVRVLTRGKLFVSSFDWSPDGSRLVIEATAGGGLDDWYHSDLYMVNADGEGEPRPLVVQPGVDRLPRFSPDGRLVAFFTAGGVHSWLREALVAVVDADGGTPRVVGREYDRTAEALDWSADGRSIYFEGAWNTTSQLFAVHADGTGFRNVSRFDGVIADVNVDARRNRAFFIQQSLTAPPELFVSALEPFVPKQLTHHNDDLRTRTLGETRLIHWKNPKDGLAIEGLLTLPPGYEAGTRLPLITWVHGGPASHFDQGFIGYLGAIYGPQVLAANGFAVLRPNPRGTGSYGEAFRRANANDWGGMDWLDVNAGIDKLIADGIADPNRLGLAGWSYGGFLASWALGHSTRFRGISIGAPVVDLVSMHGTTDIQEFLPAYFEPFTLENLHAHSPFTYLRKTAAKVLIQHGEMDDRVPPGQGTMLYRRLKELGVDVQLVTYPRSGHVPREPKQRIDSMTRNLQFFQETLRAGTP
jgi:dipeptidyl aminopeptidase/acylaminoacyl peptidase